MDHLWSNIAFFAIAHILKYTQTFHQYMVLKLQSKNCLLHLLKTKGTNFQWVELQIFEPEVKEKFETNIFTRVLMRENE